ncbi:hypothetical protein DMENIID0001_069400 [Sergentomyia squamirostris]
MYFLVHSRSEERPGPKALGPYLSKVTQNYGCHTQASVARWRWSVAEQTKPAESIATAWPAIGFGLTKLQDRAVESGRKSRQGTRSPSTATGTLKVLARLGLNVGTGAIWVPAPTEVVNAVKERRGI